MKTLLAFLVLLPFLAFGQAPPFLRTPYSTNAFTRFRVVDGGSWLRLTNEIGQSTSTEFVLIEPGDYFGTNTFSWAGRGWLHFKPGARVHHGLNNAHAAKTLFDDDGVAKDIRVTGYGQFWASNTATILRVSNNLSTVIFECQEAINDTANGSSAMLLHLGGDGDYLIRGTARNRAYDTIGVQGGRSTWHGRMVNQGGEATQAIEVTTGSDRQFAYFDFDIIEPYTNNTATVVGLGALVTLDANSHLRFGQINCLSNSNVEFVNAGVGTIPPILEGGRIHCPTNHASYVLVVGDFNGTGSILRNVTLEGGLTTVPITMAAGTLTIEGGSVIAGAVAANTIDGSGTVIVSGEPYLNKLPTGVTFNGGLYRISSSYSARASSVLQEGSLVLSNIVSSATTSAALRGILTDEVGTGQAMFTRVGVYREIWIPARAIAPATTNGAALGTNTVGADGLTIDVLDFDDTTVEYGWFQWSPPDSWDHGTVKAKFVWTTVTGTGGVVWGLAGGAVADDGTLNGAILGTAATVADTRLADHDLHLTSATGAITVGGTPTLAKPVFWRVHRLPTDGSDTKTGDARLMGIKIQYLETSTEASAW